MMTNLEYYKVFYYVAVCQSMTLAAERLMISQPAVSQSMRQLEKALDTKLIVRCARGIRLTPEGEILFSYIKQGYEEMQQGEQVLSKLKNLESGEIRIGASDMTPASVSGSVSPEIPGDQSTCHERPDPRDIDVSERR